MQSFTWSWKESERRGGARQRAGSEGWWIMHPTSACSSPHTHSGTSGFTWLEMILLGQSSQIILTSSSCFSLDYPESPAAHCTVHPTDLTGSRSWSHKPQFDWGWNCRWHQGDTHSACVGLWNTTVNAALLVAWKETNRLLLEHILFCPTKMEPRACSREAPKRGC